MEMLLNGEHVQSVEGGRIEVDNPATHRVIDTVPRATKKDVDVAVRVAIAGYRKNRDLAALERCNYLHRTSRLILERRDELVQLMISENGKSHRWATFEISKAAEIFATVAERVKDPGGSTYPMDSMVGCESYMAMVYRQSLGVVGAIIPFNFPAEMLAYKVAGALAAGNAIVVKLSEDCPLTCLRIGDALIEAGAPVESFHLLPGFGQEAGDALVRHPDVRAISFTGSSATGKLIMAAAAPSLKKLSLELGGNDPVIVFDDADVDSVARNVCHGRMTVGNGQACVADKRFIVQRAVMEQFLCEAVRQAEHLRVGDPADPAVDVGPLIHEPAAKRVEEQIADALARGATLLCGGKRFDRTFVQPTVLSNVSVNSSVFVEECFGPVVPVVGFDTEEEAVAIANDSRYGLQAAVYSRDISRALRVADRLEVGGVVINGSSCFRPGNVPYMPRKESGYGTDNMFNCVDEMSTGKAIIVSGVKL